MQNEPIISSGNTNTNTPFSASPLTSGKSPKNFKIVKISLGALCLVAVVVLAVIFLPRLFTGDSYYNENARAAGDVDVSTRYAALENYNFSFESLSSFDEKDLQEKIVYFFAYTYPKIKILSVSNVKTYVETPKVENSSENSGESSEDTEKVISYPATEFDLFANTGEKFIIKVAEPQGPYILTIFNSAHQELYEYIGGEITHNPYKENETDSLIDAIIEKLPYSSETDSKVKFDVTFEGDKDNKLSITASDENKTLSAEECGEIKTKVVEWANSLNINYSKEITAEDFTCE